eukprot:280741_1
MTHSIVDHHMEPVEQQNKPLFINSLQFIQCIQNELRIYSQIVGWMNNLKGKYEIEEMIVDYNNFMLLYGKSSKKNQKDTHIPNHIKLLWRIHLLHPSIYIKDCLKHFECIIDPQQHIFTFTSTSKLNTHSINNMNDITNNTNNKFTDLNLKQSLLNQTDWMKNVLNDIQFYKNETNINNTINEYSQFMKLISNTNKIMIPSVAIDLIWHTHMLCPLIYYKESHILANKFVFHND